MNPPRVPPGGVRVDGTFSVGSMILMYIAFLHTTFLALGGGA
jgi:hypothetical protein